MTALVEGLGYGDVQEALSVHHSGWRLESMTEGPVETELLHPLTAEAGPEGLSMRVECRTPATGAWP
jgi:hypothetical protein